MKRAHHFCAYNRLLSLMSNSFPKSSGKEHDRNAKNCQMKRQPGGDNTTTTKGHCCLNEVWKKQLLIGWKMQLTNTLYTETMVCLLAGGVSTHLTKTPACRKRPCLFPLTRKSTGDTERHDDRTSRHHLGQEK